MFKKRPTRLYVAGPKTELRWTLAENPKDAVAALGREARIPDPDDIRVFWHTSGIADMTDEERTERFDVSRQTIHNWRLKGGADLMRRTEKLAKERDDRIREVLMRTPNLSASMTAEYAKVRVEHVRRVAREMGITLAKHRKIPANDVLLKLADGRTWQELADEVGVCLAVLRTYVYKDKALAEAIRAVRKPSPVGSPAHGKIPVKKIRRMGNKGMTAYAIAKALKLEYLTVRSHLRKFAQEAENARQRRARRQRSLGHPVAGSDGGVAGQPG